MRLVRQIYPAAATNVGIASSRKPHVTGTPILSTCSVQWPTLGLNRSAQQLKTTLYANLHHLHAKRTFPIVVETASGGDICSRSSEAAGADECRLAQ